MPNVFNYTDYRRYLEDFQKEERERNSCFSHRYITQKALNHQTHWAIARG